MLIKLSIKEKIPRKLYNILLETSKIFYDHGFECYYVGGFIRDILLGKNKNFDDIDIATNAKPEEVSQLFKKTIPTGIKHGTVTILYKGFKFECTTYRIEIQYKNHRHPDKINYAKNIYEDLSRRDFTINAFAYDIIHELLIDEYNGWEDLKNKIIRCIGNPKERFLEDGLRPIRACRFMATLEFQMDENTKKAIIDSDVRKSIQSISIERFTEELKKGFSANRTSLMLKSLYELKLIEIFINKENINYNISEHFFNYLDNLKNDKIKLSYWFWYQNFEVKKISKQLKFSNQLTKICELYIEFIKIYLNFHPFLFMKENDFHLLIHQDYKKINKVSLKYIKIYKKYLGKLKKEIPNESIQLLENLYYFIIQNSYGFYTKNLNYHNFLILFYKWLINVLIKEPLIVTDLCIDGNELKKLGFKGKEIGSKLHELLDYVLENPEYNHRQYLVHLLKP